MPWTTPETFTAGQTLTAASMNAITENTRMLRGVRYASSSYSAGNITINSTSWVNLGGPADITLAAEAGNVIRVDASMLIDNQATDIYLDVVTVVSSSPVSSFGRAAAPDNAHQGIVGWRGTGSVYTAVNGSYFYTLTASDISSGNVLLRMRARTNSAVNKLILTNANYPATFFAQNIGSVTG